ncbi:SHOCT domain-containing protein [Muricoccus radiodurans]|uniref:SHOCT domain-containing protein n=1 Tax=Muricoccus radiodurans TaxID=2231721 RepID=UPI003CEE3D7A
MQDLAPALRDKIQDIAARHGVSPDAALTLLRALEAGGGAMAQFHHPELGGMGQWSRGGMVMVGDMFNQALKARVNALCTELSALLQEDAATRAAGPGSPPAGAPTPSSHRGWWPEELGQPSSSGGQNNAHYAYFPASRRLAIRQDGRVSLYDTGEHRIGGVSQQQGSGQSLTFSTDRGSIRVEDLQPVGAEGGGTAAPDLAAAPSPDAMQARAEAAAGGDALALLERLAELHRKGVLSEAEFTAKKAEILARL